MKNGQLKFYWINSRGNKEEYIDSLAEGLLKIHMHSLLEVNDESIEYNMGGLEYYDEEFLKPEYECESGFVEFYTNCGDDCGYILGEIYKVNEDWKLITFGDIVNYLKQNNIQGEVGSIKIY